MAGESQITFDDVLDDSVPDSIYTLVSSISDAITETQRERSGDNCATVSRQHTDDDSYTFCIQLPPRTGSFSISDIEGVSSPVEFVRTEVFVEETPPYTLWEFDVSSDEVESVVRVVIVKPVESPESGDDESEESFIESYEQFDFTKFVRDGES